MEGRKAAAERRLEAARKRAQTERYLKQEREALDAEPGTVPEQKEGEGGVVEGAPILKVYPFPREEGGGGGGGAGLDLALALRS